jgi:hypothetical protein
MKTASSLLQNTLSAEGRFFAGGFSAWEPAPSVAPLGLVIRGNVGPTAHAVGYHLSVLRT